MRTQLPRTRTARSRREVYHHESPNLVFDLISVNCLDNTVATDQLHRPSIVHPDTGSNWTSWYSNDAFQTAQSLSPSVGQDTTAYVAFHEPTSRSLLEGPHSTRPPQSLYVIHGTTADQHWTLATDVRDTGGTDISCNTTARSQFARGHQSVLQAEFRFVTMITYQRDDKTTSIHTDIPAQGQHSVATR